MTARYLQRARLADACVALCRERDVFAPVQGRPGDAPRLERLPAAGAVVIEPRKPLVPLKALFLPDCEEILTFRRRDGETTVTARPAMERDRVVLGALSCDVAALALVDRVMLQNPPDPAWRERRERTAIVALACIGEDDTCCCASVGVDPLRPRGADALLSPAGGGWLLEGSTEKGARIVDALEEVLREPSAAEIEAAGTLTSSSRKESPLAGCDRAWDEVWERVPWQDLAARCLGCGVCAALCPTCHCFDIQDERRGNDGARLRAWDTCAAKGYARMASGENPRSKLEARMRQRFLHKLSYFAERYGVLACVGCGRCAAHCPGATGIEEVARLLALAEADHG
jgi:sulfhydrogenase subunit beta (sulfur reductase)